MAEIKYQIKGTANTGPISATAKGVELLSSSASGAQDTMMGLEAAAQGNVTAMFSLAKSVKALWTAIQAGQMAVPLLAALSAAVWAASEAWSFFRDRQKESAAAAEEAAKKIDAFTQRVRAMREEISLAADQGATSLEPLIKQLANLAAYYDGVIKQAEDLYTWQKDLSSIRLQTKLADLESDTAGKMTGNAAADAAVRLAADRRRSEIEYEAGQADAAAQSQLIARQRTLAQENIRSLEQQSGLSTENVTRSSALVARAREERDAARGKEAWLEKEKLLKQEEARHQQLLGAEEKRQQSIQDSLSAQRTRLAMLDGEEVALKEQLKLLEAQHAARTADLSLRERAAALEAAAKKNADAAAAKTKQEADAKEAAAKARAADANRLAGLQKIAGQAQADYEKKYALATDPAARAAKRKADREAAREQSNWEKNVARAERQLERKGGDISKLTPHQRRILEAEEERKIAEGAADAAQALEKKMAEDIGQSRATLEDIRADLQKSLTMT